MSEMNIIPATPSLGDIPEQVAPQEISESSYMKFAEGYDKDGNELATNVREEIGNDGPSNSEVPSQREDKASFMIDGVDLGFVPENLRRSTIVDTLKAVEDSRSHATTKMTHATTEASNLKKLIQDQGYRDPVDMQVGTRLNHIQNQYAADLQRAEKYYLNAIDNGAMSEADANFEFGQYAAYLENQKNSSLGQEYVNINAGLVENFIHKYDGLLQSPSINNAAEVMLKDIIADGSIIDQQRTEAYLELGKGIWEEAYKAGLAASAQQRDNDSVKQRMAATQPQRKNSASSIGNSQIPWNSIEEIPQNVWNERADVRQRFGLR